MIIRNSLSAYFSSPSPSQALSKQFPHNKATVIEAELTRLLYAQAPMGLLASMVSAVILVVILHQSMPLTPLLAWFAVMGGLTSVRFVLVRRHARVAPAIEHERPWRTLYILGVLAAGLVWGAASIFLFPADFHHRTFVTFMFVGMSAGAIPLLSSVNTATLAFLTPLLLPLAARFFLRGSELGPFMGAMILLFFGVLLSAARQLHTAIVTALEFRFAHDDLYNRLRTQAAELVASNTALQEEIDKHQQTDLALRESAAKMRAIVTTAVNAVITIDEQGLIDSFNPAAERMFGYRAEEVLGKNVNILMPSPYHEEHNGYLANYRQTGEAKIIGSAREVVGRRKDGSTFPLELSVGEVLLDNGRRLFTGIARDITNRKQTEEVLQKSREELEQRVRERTAELRLANQQLEAQIVERTRMEEGQQQLQAQLAQAQKLQSLGTLAGGIAHDFNNLLTPIIGFSELLKKAAAPGTVAWQNLHEVLKASHRAKELVQQMLAFSRPSQQALEPVVLSDVVEDCLALLRAGLPSTIEIHHRFDPAAGMVLADPAQLHQVVMNLGVNALQAMEGHTGRLEITIRSELVTDNFAALHPPLVPGSYGLLEVRDTGSGITTDVQPRIFDPFFTTKDIGKGSGLGLSVVHSIISSLGGAILVESTPGQGSTFTVYLPRLATSAAHAQPEEARFPPHGHGRILLVDDEPAITRLAQQMLTTLGYEVVAVTDSQEALTRLRQEPRHFDMLMTDQRMPGLQGTELALAARSLHPTLPTIIWSGAPFSLPEELAPERGDIIQIKKPFTMEQLGQALRQLLRPEEEIRL